MKELGSIKKLELRELWSNEARDFTPWLAENISLLSEALGMDLGVETREAGVGDFSLDLLAKDLGTGRIVIIENQLNQTDHDHLGKVLTYAGGFEASVIIWISQHIRDEHRQALEWLNEKTYQDVDFFGVVVEAIQIDNSKPAIVFNPVVYPNEWQKTGKRTTARETVSPRAEAYRVFYQKLIDELRVTHKFTGAKVAQPCNWHVFSSGYFGITYGVSFSLGEKVRAEVYIDTRDQTTNKKYFDNLFSQKDEIQKELGFELEWERLDEKQGCRIAVYRPGTIDDESSLQEIHEWLISHLLKLKKVFGPILKKVTA